MGSLLKPMKKAERNRPGKCRAFGGTSRMHSGVAGWHPGAKRTPRQMYGSCSSRISGRAVMTCALARKMKVNRLILH